MMAAYPSQEHRMLKKPKLGPPDVYPQDPKQKEDELTATNVKQGFNNSLVISDEYGSARNLNISQEKFGAFFTAVMAKKTELNTCSDTGKKKQQLNKDNFWPAARSRTAMEAWFKDLAGSKPLSQLGKKVPLFPKKEEIFLNLCEFSIPVIKAAWFIKMTAAYNIALQENKTKKRQIVDQSVDWTFGITKFMKDQLQKIQEYHSGGSQQTSFLTASQAPSQLEMSLALKLWHYCCRLSKHMSEEGLLDRHDMLSWLVEQFVEKLQSTDDTVLKLVLDQIVRNLDEFTLNQLLSRRLAYYCAKKLAQLCSESGCTSPRTQSPMLNSNGTQGPNNSNTIVHNPVAMVFSEYNSCLQHRGVVLGLSAALQTITLKCPCAMVWNNLGETPGAKNNLLLCGSPLDLLPCAPSSLPMPPGPQNQQIRSQIRAAEHQIKLRGRAAEIRWSSDKCQQSTTGFTISRILAVLDILDRHNFEMVEPISTLDSLYAKIFPTNSGKENSTEPPIGDEPIINLLIDWAVSVHRYGDHRALVVAKLLERRQSEIRTEKFAESEVLDEKESMGSEAMAATGLPPFQNLFIQFLDEKAPVLDDNPSAENKQAFGNLIHLFCELIRNDVFSHDAYMCTLIARGDLASSGAAVAPLGDSMDLSSVKSEAIKQEVMPQDEIKMDLDLQNSEMSDMYWNKLFNEPKVGPRMSPEPPSSVKSIKSEVELPQILPGPMSMGGMAERSPPPPQPKGPSRHLQYATHFPIPQDDASYHECNQRMVVLYGVGKSRDEAKHISKKVTKEILKLFSRKNCIDVSSGAVGKDKKKKEKESDSSTNLEATFHKFQKLSYYDQHAVTSACAASVLELINTFMSSSPSYLPLIDNISYLFDLMEYSLNLNGLMEFCVQLLKELIEVEVQLTTARSGLAGNYCSPLCMCIVALFRRYHTYLLVAQDWAVQSFDSLISVVRHVSNPTDCSSAERCILSYLYDVYMACCYIKSKFTEVFSNAYTTMTSRLCVPTQPSSSNLRWDEGFMADIINSARPQADAQSIRQLNESAAYRYSFVCNAMLKICVSQVHVADRLNDISILCAELTARCNALSSEWLGVLRALCVSSNHSCGFIDVLTQIDVSDLSIHDSLAVFTSILIARHCFSLQDFVGQVALPSLMAACPSTGGDQDAESGARLTCHLLLHLFKSSPVSVATFNQHSKNICNVRASCDRNLLTAAHASITVGAVLAVLKAMLVLGDSCGEEEGDSNTGNIFTLMKSMVDNPVGPSGGGNNGGMETAGLSEYAKHTLKEIRSQEWVQEKFLKDPEGLFNQDLLLDSMLSPKQAQQLLQMLCYPNGVQGGGEPDREPDNRQVIQRILQTLDQWSLRLSLLELQLMFKQSSSQSETNTLLDNIARGTIDLFQQQTENRNSANRPSSPSIVTNDGEKEDVWLVAPLISKLGNGAQGRVLRLAGNVLESSNNLFLSSKGKMDREKNQKSKSLLSHQPFLSLVLTCLKGQDEQREGLLNSLASQLEKFINNAKEILDKSPDEGKIRQNLHEALQLRLSLVGGMFDTIQRNNSLTSDWAIILLQLISYNVVDSQTNSELCTTVLDMLSILILSSQVVEVEKGEDNKKIYSNLIKKLKKELGNKHTDATDQIRQLLPLPQKSYEVITCEPHGTLVDTKGNKIAGFDSICKKQGHQVASKVKVSAWEVIEGYKNPAPLSWTYFGAVKLERNPLKYEEQFRMLLYHTHSLRKPSSYYLEAPPLPPEDLEPIPDKVIILEEKPQESQDTQKEETNNKKGRRKRRPNRPSNTNTYMQVGKAKESNPRNMPDAMFQTNPNSTWYQQQQPQPYTFQQPGQGSKVALNNMLRARNTGTSFNQSQPQLVHTHMMMRKQQQQQQMIRHRLQMHQQNTMQSRMMAENPGMYGSSLPPTTPQASYTTQSIPQAYPAYSNIPQPQQPQPGPPAMMEQPHTNMIPQTMTPQSYPATGSTMMPNMRQQPGYMAQQPQQTLQPPYNQTSRVHQNMGANMSAPATQPMTNMTGYNQMVQPQQPHNTYSGNMSTMQQQHRYRQLQQQQMMAAQQQAPQHQQTMQNQQQQTAALVAQLQRQLSSNPQPQAPPPQYQQHQYQQHPQY